MGTFQGVRLESYAIKIKPIRTKMRPICIPLISAECDRPFWHHLKKYFEALNIYFESHFLFQTLSHQIDVFRFETLERLFAIIGP